MPNLNCLVGPGGPTSCIGSLAKSAAQGAAGAAFDAIAKDFGKLAQHVTGWLWATMGSATAVRLGGPGWARDLGITCGLAMVLASGLFLLQLISSALRRDPAGVGRALRGLLVAGLGSFAAILITETLLTATDAVANGIMVAGTGQTTWAGLGHKLLSVSTLDTSLGAAALLVVSMFVIASSVIVWAALMVRKLLLIVTAVFAPVAFAGSVFAPTASWVRKWVEFTAALIASKIILVVIFVVGLGVLGVGVGQTAHPSAGQQVTTLTTGCLILCLAGFAPWLAIKLVHFAGDSFHTVHVHAASVTGAGQSAIAAPQKLARQAQTMSKYGAVASSGGTATSGVAAGTAGIGSAVGAFRTAGEKPGEAVGQVSGTMAQPGAPTPPNPTAPKVTVPAPRTAGQPSTTKEPTDVV